MQRLLVIGCLIFLTGATSACFTGGIPQSPKHTVYTLYLEDVQLPDEIHANEPFTLRLVYSASQNPGVFNDNNLYWGIGFLSVKNKEVMTGNMYILHDNIVYKIGEKSPSEPNVYSQELSYAEPGTYVLLIGTAADRSMGGRINHVSFSNGPAYISGVNGYSHREVIINVLP
jgi:hypothetical protein